MRQNDLDNIFTVRVIRKECHLIWAIISFALLLPLLMGLSTFLLREVAADLKTTFGADVSHRQIGAFYIIR